MKIWWDYDFLSEIDWKWNLIFGSSFLKLDKLNWWYRLLEWWLFDQIISLSLRKWWKVATNWIDGISGLNDDFLIEILILNSKKWWNDSILSEKDWKRLLYLTQVISNFIKWVDCIGCWNNNFLISQLLNMQFSRGMILCLIIILNLSL